jgi:hypothetical protein
MRRHWVWMLAIGAIACGKHGDSGASVAAAPSHAGDVWEADKASDRKTAPATVIAFVNGLHTVVVDGNDVYSGTTRLSTTEDSAGGRTVKLANGLAASFDPAGDGMELRFSSGEKVPMRKQQRRTK